MGFQPFFQKMVLYLDPLGSRAYILTLRTDAEVGVFKILGSAAFGFMNEFSTVCVPGLRSIGSTIYYRCLNSFPFDGSMCLKASNSVRVPDTSNMYQHDICNYFA